MANFLTKIFGTHSSHELKKIYPIADKVDALEEQFKKLTDDELLAIRWHMGFSGPEDNRTVGQALQKYPLAFALAVADMEASYFLEGED